MELQKCCCCIPLRIGAVMLAIISSVSTPTLLCSFVHDAFNTLSNMFLFVGPVFVQHRILHNRDYKCGEFILSRDIALHFYCCKLCNMHLCAFHHILHSEGEYACICISQVHYLVLFSCCR